MTDRMLGHYRVVEKIGAGGMGEVYRAADPKLGRDVAIKVVTPEFARDPERLARFEREARVLASLNHPNIAAIYGFEQAGGVPFLVLEYVPGQTLKGPLPVDEALSTARQIAEALEAAHEKGIVHRDLKPANVKITPEGKVKVLDFGLAKAFAGEDSGGDPTNSPTLSVLATKHGAILGTAAYMSPEQARGKAVDRRTDIWAFGCVLYEMLTGKQAFPAETISDAIAGILAREPDWNALPAATPEHVRDLLRHCLQKELAKRLRHIDDAQILLEEVPRPPTPSPRPPARQRLLPWAVAAVAVVALGAVLAAVALRPEAAQPVLRYTISPPEKSTTQHFAISPDGRHLAIAATTIDAKNHLWVRSLDNLESRLLPGTDGATLPFWSPDSRYIAFFTQDKLKKIPVTGGPPQSLCDAPRGTGGSWSHDGVIAFAAAAGNFTLQRVPASGGAPSPLEKGEGPRHHHFPVFLPGRHDFFYVRHAEAENRGTYLGSLDSQQSRRALPDISAIAYAPPAPGSGNAHLLFLREETLMAQPFDTKTLQPGGEPFPIAEDVSVSQPGSFMPYTVSENGVLAYQTGRTLGESQLVWYDRAGKQLGVAGPPGRVSAPSFSPDEKTIAVARAPTGDFLRSDIWLHEISRGNETRFTAHPGNDGSPIWSPDGSRIVYRSYRGVQADLYQKDSSGAGQEELLFASQTSKSPTHWSRDGRYLVYQEQSPAAWDLWVLPMQGERKPFVFLKTEFAELHGQLSPDGRWMAYTSNESGRPEVYVRPFPSADAKWKVSTAGGEQPRWRRDGKELYYVATDRKLMAVAVRAGTAPRGGFELGTTQALFQTRLPLSAVGTAAGTHYDVSADGKRFLLVTNLQETSDAPITVVVNWLAGVKR